MSWPRSGARRRWITCCWACGLGDDPRLCVTTTPRPSRMFSALLEDPTTVVSRASTYANRGHLAPAFYDRIITKYEGTRLGRQELLAELLQTGEGAWFKGFDPDRHVSELPSMSPGCPSTWRSTAASPATWVRCGSRCIRCGGCRRGPCPSGSKCRGRPRAGSCRR